MADKIKKALSKLSSRERENVKLLLLRIKLNDLDGLDVKALKGIKGNFRVRKGAIRIIFIRQGKTISILRIDRRSEGTYKNL